MNSYVKNGLPFLKKPYVLLPWLRAHPYSWSADEGPIHVSSTWAKHHWHLNAGMVQLYCIFVFYRTVEAILDPRRTLITNLEVIFSAAIYFWVALFNVFTFTTRDSLVPFVRAYIQFLLMTRQNVIGRQAKLCKLLLTFIWYSSWSNVLLFPVLNILRPRSPEFLSSVLADYPGPISFLATTVSCMSQTFFQICFTKDTTLLCAPLITFMMSMPEFL